MKSFIKVFILSFVSSMVLISTSQAAPLTCPSMKIIKISQTSMWAKNVSGAACGNIPNNTSQYFVLNPATTDRLLAISLTAMSLQKVVWLHAAGDVSGSIVDIISISD